MADKAAVGSATPLAIVAWVAAAGAAIATLVVAQRVLVPLVFAFGLWLIVNALASQIGRAPYLGKRLPQWARLLGALLVIIAIIVQLTGFVGDSIAGVVADAPRYQERLGAALAQISTAIGFDVAEGLRKWATELDLSAIIAIGASMITEIASTFGAVIVYAAFLFLEQRVFPGKIAALAQNDARSRTIRETLSRVNQGVASYLSTKTLIATSMGLFSYAILSMAGVEHAPFWAFVIFLLDYIPTIGSLAAVLLATLAALAQFGEIEPTLIVGGSLAILQIVMGNVVEPRLMAGNLNLSPLVVILSLSVWGLIWGSIGLFLAVPLTAAVAIVLAEFRATRPVAILLSETGHLRRGER